MQRNLGQGEGGGNLVNDLNKWTPLERDLEAQDNEESLKGGGIEVGDTIKLEKKHGVVVDAKKLPGEVKKGATEAVSKNISPLDVILAKEADQEEYVSGETNPKEVASVQTQVADERAARRAVEKAAGWTAKAELIEESEEAQVSKVPSTEGMRKSVWQNLKGLVIPRFVQPYRPAAEEGRRTIQTPKRKTEPYRRSIKKDGE
ncbi:MAG: hypothetical protein WC725_05585 [Patescibacteria group bacterium]|jgi:hypothetical protein